MKISLLISGDSTDSFYLEQLRNRMDFKHRDINFYINPPSIIRESDSNPGQYDALIIEPLSFVKKLKDIRDLQDYLARVRTNDKLPVIILSSLPEEVFRFVGFITQVHYDSYVSKLENQSNCSLLGETLERLVP